MPNFSGIAFTTLFLEIHHFLTTLVSNHGQNNSGAFNIRHTDLQLIPVGECDHLAQLNILTGFSFQAFNRKCHSRCNSVLLTTGLQNRIRFHCIFFLTKLNPAYPTL